MVKVLPKVEFKMGRRRVSPTARRWLIKKRDYLSDVWTKEGLTILSNIEEHCGFSFPARTISEGMVVYLFQLKRSNDLGNMNETKPLECNLFLRKGYTWTDVKAVLIHELIHCLMWQKFYFDLRTRKPTFFADVFADELMACVVECLVLGHKPSYQTCDDAIDCAIGEAVYRLSETDERGKLVRALGFLEEYCSKMKNKESNILKAREGVLGRLPSLIPEKI